MWGAVEQGVQAFEFAIYGDAKRLEDARRRIDSADPNVAGDALDQQAQVGGGFERTAAPSRDDRACNPPGAALFAVFVKDAGEFLFAFLVDEIVGGQRFPPIHPHIERSVEPEAEAARGIVERVT